MIDVNSRPIYLRELYSNVESVRSDDGMSSEYFEDDTMTSEYLHQMDQILEDLQCKLDENNRRFKYLGGQVDASIQ